MKLTHYLSLYGKRSWEALRFPSPRYSQPARPGGTAYARSSADRWVSTPDGAQTSCGWSQVFGAIRLAAGAVAIRTFLAVRRAIESSRGLTDNGEIEPWRG